MCVCVCVWGGGGGGGLHPDPPGPLSYSYIGTIYNCCMLKFGGGGGRDFCLPIQGSALSRFASHCADGGGGMAANHACH